MAWEHPLFRRRTLHYRPISLILLVMTCSVVVFWVASRPPSPPVPIPSQNETKAIQAAWAQHSGKVGGVPGPGTFIKATKLKGEAWIVQIEEIDREIESYSLNTYYVSGPRLSCQWLSIVAH